MFAYIPARGGSKRIPKKNIKLLDGTPLIIHVINNLKLIPELKGIAVSTDCPETITLLKDVENVTTLEPRDELLSNDQATFTDLINKDLPRFIEHFESSNILFTTATAALVKTESYLKGIQVFKNNGLVMSVTNYDHSPFLALKKNSQNELIPLFPDSYTLPTKDLQPCYVDCGCFYIFNSKEFKNKEKLIDLSPIIPVILSSNEGIDLDTTEDWALLEAAYNKTN